MQQTCDLRDVRGNLRDLRLREHDRLVSRRLDVTHKLQVPEKELVHDAFNELSEPTHQQDAHKDQGNEPGTKMVSN